ncbi:MAG: SGNH/GDSL hydrolase family protein, partial [Bacteroidales bacterium]|nr:SGNH/GDSL hydrolase family protein [Bacteroidales bacterium]
GGDGKKGRVWISDLTVEVTALVDDIAGAKKLSIIGDSISSFEGWLPEGNKYFADYYIGGGLQDWTKTYWGALCTKYMVGKLQMEKNISWTGSCVAQDTRTGSSYRPAFVTRYGKSNVGATYALNSIGSPDIVIIYGGTNDRYNSGYGLSDVNSTPDDAEFDAIFKKSNDNLVVTSFVQAYVKLINMVHADCPDAKIINIIGDYVTLEQIASIKKISDHYTFCKYVDFSNGGSGNPKIGKLNGVHPNIDGMDYMAKTIFGELGDWMLED